MKKAHRLDTCQDSRAFHLALGSTYGDITQSYLTRSLKRPQPWPADRCLRTSYHHYTSEPCARLFKKAPKMEPAHPSSTSHCSKALPLPCAPGTLHGYAGRAVP